MRKLNIGVLSCANIAKKFILPTLDEMKEFNLLGIASRTKEKADAFAKEFNTKAFYSYESLLEEKALDAVYIPLPNSMHYTWVKKSLEKGLHVLVEKSMACNVEEVEELNVIAKEKNLVLIENFQFRFHAQLQYIKELVNNGEIGELRNIRASFGFPPFPDGDKNIRYKKELGGGALLDAAAYPLKISQLFLGDNLFIDSATLVTPKDKEVDIWGCATLKQREGNLSSQIAFGFDHYYQNSIELWGSKGKISANRIFTAAPNFEPSIEVETNEKRECINLEADHHFKNMLTYFYKSIIDKSSCDDEYKYNINQARLLHELKEKASE